MHAIAEEVAALAGPHAGTLAEKLDAYLAGAELAVSGLNTLVERLRTAREQAERRAAEAEAKLAAAAHLVAETYAALDAAGAPVAIADARGESVLLSLAQRVERLEKDRNSDSDLLAALAEWNKERSSADKAEQERDRLRAEVATERALRAQAEGRYESAAEMVAAERARAEAAERERDQLRDMFASAIDAAERAHRGYPLPSEEWYALRDSARALLEDAAVAQPIVSVSPPIPEAALRWLRSGDTGTSSLTIYEVMTGHPQALPVGHGHPWDPSDFGRCYRLLKLVPEWRNRLHEVAAQFPRWAPFVERWTEMERLYEEEAPSGRAPRLYRLMKELAVRRRSTAATHATTHATTETA